MLKLKQLDINIESSALKLINQLLYNPDKAYVNNKGTYWEFGNKLQFNIHQIKKNINRGYKFSPYKLKIKRMKNGKLRKLYLPTWQDKIVERWLADNLNEKLHKWFSPNSYAYRKYEYGINQCQTRVLKSITPNNYIIKRDISNCFYSINHEIILKQLEKIIDKNDELYRLVHDRIVFEYIDNDETKTSDLGLPFGSSIACILANIHLTDLDRTMSKLPVKYFRYADDFLIVTDDQNIAKLAIDMIDHEVNKLQLQIKPSHKLQVSFVDNQIGFDKVFNFKYLGLEYTSTGKVRLTLEKYRKIFNFVKRSVIYSKNKDLPTLIKKANTTISKRIRSTAIIDYYLKHINDEQQLKQLDIQIAQLIISTHLGKPFRFKDFSKISFKKLRELGLISLVHRHRLHKQGHLKVQFLQLQNDLLIERSIAREEKLNKLANINKLDKKLKNKT